MCIRDRHPSEFTQIGADIEVQVLEIDKENRRLSLGHKQLEENPWAVSYTHLDVYKRQVAKLDNVRMALEVVIFDRLAKSSRER